MNKKRWIPIALAALTLGACSDDNVSDNGNEPQWNAEGKGYVALALNLPTTSEVASKAEDGNHENDQFNDGEAREWAVNNATLLIFTGTSENTATFHSAYELNLNNWNDVSDEPNQITTATKITQLINNYDTEETTAYALVVLNHNGLLAVQENAGLKIDGTTVENTDTWPNVQKTLIANKSLTDDGIMMVNATLTTAQGGNVGTEPSGDITTLVALDDSYIYNTAAEAASGTPAATIYAERAVAKVEVKSTASGTLNGTSGADAINYTIDGWILDITNTKTYLAHVTNADWLGYKSAGVAPNAYRFAGNAPVEEGMTTPLYRSYWAEDPNYSGTVALTDFTKIAEGAMPSDFLDVNADYAYCLENTFDLSNMNDDQSTRAIVRAKFNDGKTFYTLDQSTEEFYDEEGMKALFKARLLQDQGFRDWTAKNIEGGENTVTAEKIELTFDPTEEGKGNMEVATIAFTDDIEAQTGGTTVIPDNYKTLVNGLNVQKYNNGYSYYPVIIKHFGDTQTPWNTWEETAGADVPSNEDVYPGANADANYLGRYGVVRNNWYELTVSKVSKLGWPDVPPTDGGRNDNMDAYISVEINILSWAKRTQNVEL